MDKRQCKGAKLIQPQRWVKIAALLTGWAGLSVLVGCQEAVTLQDAAAGSLDLKPAADQVIQTAITPFEIPLGAPDSPLLLKAQAANPASSSIANDEVIADGTLGSDG
ncbi:MAG: hypothetical protein AAF889_08770, partial [Cyanobacteria bacterium P01_D01_bin.73]